MESTGSCFQKSTCHPITSTPIPAMPLATLLVSCVGETTGKSMKNVRLVRHGESAANDGAATLDHASIPLTEKGIEQAKRVAQSVGRAPDLIVTSPFSRARATADATISIFPDVPSETWPIEESTYLDPTRCVNTTLGQRKAWSNSIGRTQIRLTLMENVLSRFWSL